ncbi:aquaporin family protein [Bradyrhizobium sp. CB2312]|nr:MIP/aquaporin family protein [Bradyrhizobium sp. CB2312]WFU77159.1 aquaporin family protein [Bradyrhizobium sp. CB2312]
MPSMGRRIVSEWLGTAFLVAAVVGSGIMAQRLAGGNVALAFLCNTISTGAILVVLILVFGPLSGAHFNPAVSLALTLRGELTWRAMWAYILAQISGSLAGVFAAHLMFDIQLWQVSLTQRTGAGQWISEAAATFGLLVTIFGCASRTPAAVPYGVGLYVTSAYWFTASTSFANPAVTIARSLSDTFAGIAPSSVVPFIIAQLIGPWQPQRSLQGCLIARQALQVKAKRILEAIEDRPIQRMYRLGLADHRPELRCPSWKLPKWP